MFLLSYYLPNLLTSNNAQPKALNNVKYISKVVMDKNDNLINITSL